MSRAGASGIVLYDFMAVPGGAEKVTSCVLRALPGTALCIGFLRPEARALVTGLAHPLIDLRADSSFPAIKVARTIHAFSRRAPSLTDYAWALFSGSYAPLAIRKSRAGRNVLYCHALPRFCYDLREHYLRETPRLLRPALQSLTAYLEPRYREAVQGMDIVVANSANVQSRLQRFLGQASVVVHPPIDTTGYRWVSDGDFYLSVARHEPLKRVDSIIRAFLQMPARRLVVASGGSARHALEALAQRAPNIHFTGWLAEEAMQSLVGRARAVIYVPVDEDFGMSPVEAMAAGKPVIGVAEGGLRETVRHNETGWLIDGEVSATSIAEAVEQLERLGPESMRVACERQAGQFAEAVFVERISEILSAESRLG